MSMVVRIPKLEYLNVWLVYIRGLGPIPLHEAEELGILKYIGGDEKYEFYEVLRRDDIAYFVRMYFHLIFRKRHASLFNGEWGNVIFSVPELKVESFLH